MRADMAEARVDQAIALADRTLAQLADANTRADRAEQTLAGERQRADSLRDRIDVLSGELRSAQQREVEWWARPLLARLKAAWRGAN
jgi:hypothetical protein